jgi:hypothetical protein
MQEKLFRSGASVILSRLLLVPQYNIFVYTFEINVFVSINSSRGSSVDTVTRLWAEQPTRRHFVPESLPFSRVQTDPGLLVPGALSSGRP